MLIQFDHVSKSYGSNITALDDVSFSIDKGDFVFLVGTSGAGKTTILRLITKDLVPTAGKIMVGDMEINKLRLRELPQLRRQTGMVFQDFKVLYDRTIFENIAIALEIQAKPTAEIKRKVKEVLHIVSLDDKGDFFPVQLSAGELQRTSIARAIVGGPQVLLADEPTGNLDPTSSWEILKILKEINKLGTTLLMATHNVDIVNSMKKRVITLKKGKIIRDQKEGKY
jgi:cell division transport system ATP-binding protein